MGVRNYSDQDTFLLSKFIAYCLSPYTVYIHFYFIYNDPKPNTTAPLDDYKTLCDEIPLPI